MSNLCNCNQQHIDQNSIGTHNKDKINGGQGISSPARQQDARSFLVVTGPTAVGKTTFVDDLAALLNYEIEIINADVGQFYCPLTIGTAKPSLDAPIVPHHLFDLYTEPYDGTVAAYRQQVANCLESIWQRGRLPVVVGGSLFYLKALFYPPHNLPKAPQADENAKNAALLHNNLTSDQLYERVYAIDPERAVAIGQRDRYRLIRALDIFSSTHKKPSLYKPTLLPLARASLIFFTRDRLELHQRINTRVGQMFSQGWVAEVKQLSPAWRSFLQQKKLIGYPEIITYLENGGIEEHVQDAIRKKTRAMAKRQLTFWRSFITLLVRDRLHDNGLQNAIDEIIECNISTDYKHTLERIANRVIRKS